MMAIGIRKIKYIAGNNEGGHIYQFVFYRNSLDYIVWMDIEAGDILMEMMNIDRKMIE
jgi:hypothetical protein